MLTCDLFGPTNDFTISLEICIWLFKSFDLRGERADIIKYPVLIVLGVGAQRGIQDVIEFRPACGGAIDRIIGEGAIEARSSRESLVLDLRVIPGMLRFTVIDAHL